MTSSVRAVVLGLDYQARYFWIQACRLFYEQPVVERVSIERPEFKAFDDVVARYRMPILDAHGRLIEGDHYQNKFHVDYDHEIHGDDLIDPGFIGARTHSLLDRLAQATRRGRIPHRMTLVTPWRISNSDPLRKLISPRDGELVLHHLLGTGVGRDIVDLRERWRTALGGPDDEHMAEMLMHLQIWDGKSQADLDALLDVGLERAGLAPIDRASLRHPYRELAERFTTGDRDHDRARLEAILRREGLWVGRPAPTGHEPTPLGIKSFARFAVNLEDDAKVLNLVPFFHGRETAADVSWDADIFPRVRDFLETEVRSGGTYDIHLDAHLSIGFAAGFVLDKADAVVAPVQRQPTGGRERWTAAGSDTGERLWEDVTWIDVGSGPEIAVAIEVTHPTRDDVATYVKRSLLAVGRVACLTVAGGPSRTAVRDGGHAHALAASAGPLLRDLRPAADRAQPLHLFPAGPVGLIFLLGRQASPWGRLILYEFPFGSGAAGAYLPSIHLPQP